MVHLLFVSACPCGCVFGCDGTCGLKVWEMSHSIPSSQHLLNRLEKLGRVGVLRPEVEEVPADQHLAFDVAPSLVSEDAEPIRGRESFNYHDSFFDKVQYFTDPDFWEAYNIIEPSESLEHAIGKLRKK